MAEVTHLLQRLREGDRGALDELLPLVYNELRRIAGSSMQGQPAGHTLQPTALMNEAFIRLFEDTKPAVADRVHLLALMSRVMRQVLVDHARTRRAAKRGGNSDRVPWSTNIEVRGDASVEPVNVLDLHAALEALERENPSLGEIVEQYYFGGMTAEEVARSVGRSPHVVRHELRAARAWLHRRLAS
jgi:RNA polymerase sigma factor (TIGR02999 family)